MARKSNGNGKNNGHITLPQPAEMAEFCHDRLSRLKDDKQREFVSDIYVITRRGVSLSLGRLGYLVSIYIQHWREDLMTTTMLEPVRDQFEIFVDGVFRHAKRRVRLVAQLL